MKKKAFKRQNTWIKAFKRQNTWIRNLFPFIHKKKGFKRQNTGIRNEKKRFPEMK